MGFILIRSSEMMRSLNLKTLPLIDDFDKMDGFLLYYSNDHFFGSQWKDHPIIIRSFVPVESAENKNENTEKTVPPEPSPETETLSETKASPTSSLSEYLKPFN